jgi:hypothetical protein
MDEKSAKEVAFRFTLFYKDLGPIFNLFTTELEILCEC